MQCWGGGGYFDYSEQDLCNQIKVAKSGVGQVKSCA